MAKHISFIVLGGAGKLVKQFDLKRWVLGALVVVVISGVAVLGFGVFDYMRLHQDVSKNKHIEQVLAQQNDQVIHQRKQIQTFAAQIDALKERLVMLDQFEKKIRIIASMENPDKHDGLFGVGGSAPEDINPNMGSAQGHAQMLRQMHRQMDQLEDASQNKQDSLSILLNELERQKNVLSHTPTIRPAEGWISSRFGYRVSPFTEKREFHKGIDIANRLGTPVIATADGVVSFTGAKGQLGNVIVLDHGYGIKTRFAHIGKALKKRGEHVQRGDPIAQMGNTGRSTGPHLHYEVHLNGVPVNPVKYIMN